MLATTLGSDPFVGRILTGRVETGKLKVGQTIQALSRVGQKIEQFRVTKIRAFRGLSQQDIDEGGLPPDQLIEKYATHVLVSGSTVE